MTFQPGDYVEFSVPTYVQIGERKWELNKFPYKVWSTPYNPTVGEYTVLIKDFDREWLVRFSTCYKVRPPKPSLAEKERIAMQKDLWRTLRDEYLTGVFKPPQREKPSHVDFSDM